MSYKQQLLDENPYCVAYHYSGDVEINFIDYGIEDRALCVARTTVHLVKIHDGNRAYIRINGVRYYMDEFIRV